jgi:hypothetical protein
VELEAALTKASEEWQLASYYRDCVRPFLRNPEGPWPRCCDSGCEPCNAVLVRVAARALELMGSPRKAALPF